MTDVLAETDLDLDPEEDEAPIELTREQELSRKTLRELQQICKDPAYGLSAAGRATDLIARIVAFENGEPLGADAIDPNPKPGIAPTPVAPTVTPASALITGPVAPVAPADVPAAAPVKATPAPKQKTGFFEATNTYRAEFPLGPRATIDDPTHYQFIEETHNAARAAGYRPKGAPYAGTRVGFSVIRTENGAMRSVIYEVCAREVE
jgi:hypothetical protein